MWSAVLLLAVLPTACLAEPRDRTCCRYADPAADLCSAGPDACVLRGNTGSSSPDLDECSVTEDSKRDFAGVDGSRKGCLKESFEWDGSSDLEAELNPPVSVAAYAFQDAASPEPIAAVEIGIDYGLGWDWARFRVANRDKCPSEDGEVGEGCEPRCVEISRGEKKESNGASKRLVYDCEVGFYTGSGRQVHLTQGDTYQLDHCLGGQGWTSCGSHLFVMPALIEGEPELDAVPLLDLNSLKRDGVVVLNFPGELIEAATNLSVVLLREGGDGGEVIAAKDAVLGGGMNATLIFAEDDLALAEGDYTIALEPRGAVVARFRVESDSGGGLAGVVILLLLLLAAAGLGFYLYRRYKRIQTASVVHPNQLLKSGRIGGRSVFVVTNVDCRQHIDVVMDFNKYLKAHCAASEVYFALDPNTGITSHPDHDPWRWAQDVADRVGSREDALLVFLAAPPPAMGLPVYKDLPNNQAFVAAKYLKSMSDEGRVAVVHFPYSDPATVPGLVPPHLTARPLHLPQDMNDLLCQMLKVKRRQLVPLLPVPLVQPRVLPSDFARYSGGKALLENINALTAKVDLHKAEVARLAAAGGSGSSTLGTGGMNGGLGSTLSRCTEETASTFSDSEEDKKLLGQRQLQQQQQQQQQKGVNGPDDAAVQGAERSTLEIEIEAGVKSLKSDELTNKRDRRIHPELEEEA